jgi:hypothetical protein
LRVNVYVDGFNLYYRALKDGPHRWLDLGALASHLLTTHTVHRVRYFTARVKARADPQQPARQQTYLRALATVPNLTIHLGTFMDKKTGARLVTPMPLGTPGVRVNPDGTHTVKVHKTEEKGSDVNLASFLLLDGFQADYEGAAVITNDSDLATPIGMVRDELRIPVFVLDPSQSNGESRELKAVATHYRKIRVGPLSASQFPATLTDATGTITKPTGW